jgi:hypothetical protein
LIFTKHNFVNRPHTCTTLYCKWLVLLRVLLFLYITRSWLWEFLVGALILSILGFLPLEKREMTFGWDLGRREKWHLPLEKKKIESIYYPFFLFRRSQFSFWTTIDCSSLEGPHLSLALMNNSLLNLWNQRASSQI